jgi:hypothetical protein
LHPYGWVEVDPALRQFGNFDYGAHWYEFSRQMIKQPRLTMIENGSCSAGQVEEALELLLKHKSKKIYDTIHALPKRDRILKTRKYQQAKSLEDTLFKEELEYLRGVREN